MEHLMENHIIHSDLIVPLLTEKPPNLVPGCLAPAVYLTDVEATCQRLSLCKEELTPLWAHGERTILGKVQQEGRFRAFENDTVSVEKVCVEFIEARRLTETVLGHIGTVGSFKS